MRIYIMKVSDYRLSKRELENYIPSEIVENVRESKDCIAYLCSLIAYSALYVISKQVYGFSEKLTLKKNQYGKPFFSEIPNYHFNISHSKNWVVLATSFTEVGIDVEYKEPFEYCEVVNSFFSEREKEFFRNVPITQNKDCFYKLWTLKESYIKAVGRGMSLALDSFSVEVWSNPISISNGLNSELKNIDFAEDYSLSVCFQKGDTIETLEYFKILS